jgi:hypothetical protein
VSPTGCLQALGRGQNSKAGILGPREDKATPPLRCQARTSLLWGNRSALLCLLV